MRTQKLTKLIAISMLSLGAICAFGAEQTASATTLDNLQAAYNGESNANAKYEAFAIKADAEGYKGVAVLFRAAAKAESIHSAKYAKQITKLDAKPTADIKTPDVKSTKENLQAAIDGETYEATTMYPAFIKQAQVDENKQAERSFKSAMEVEAGHAKLYQQALDNLDSWKDAKVFIVCPVCGYTTMNLDIKKCPICAEPRSKFYTIK